MSDTLAAEFGFTISPDQDGWSWTTFDRAGEPRASGRARSRAVAAAFVIRDLTHARSPHPTGRGQ